MANPANDSQNVDCFARHELVKLVGHRKKVYTIGWNCTGTRLASGSVDQTIKIWNGDFKSSEQKHLSELLGHKDSVNNITWKPDAADVLASTTQADKTVRIWDARSNKCTASIATQGSNMHMAWHPDGLMLAVVNHDNLVTFIDARTTKVARTLKLSSPVNEIGWGPSKDVFCASTTLGSVEFLSYPALKPVQTIRPHTAATYCVQFSRGGKYLATGGADAMVTLWDMDSLACVRTFVRMDQPVRTLSFSHNSRFLAYASEDATIDVVDIHAPNPMPVFTMTGLKSSSDCVAWSPVALALAFAQPSEDKDVGGIGVLVPRG